MTERLERDLERLLSAAGERVDDATRQELAARRRAVLDAAESGGRPGWLAASWWLPAGAVAAALLAMLMIRPGMQSMPDVADSDDAIDMEIMLAEENLELYDDLEFFEWLAVVDDEAG